MVDGDCRKRDGGELVQKVERVDDDCRKRRVSRVCSEKREVDIE